MRPADVYGYYEQLTAFLDNMVQQGFLVPEHRNMVLASHIPTELLDSFTDYRAPEVEKWIENKKGV